MSNAVSQTPAAKQSVLTVTFAELHKFIRPGGIRTYLIVAATLAWVTSGLVLYLLSFPSMRGEEAPSSADLATVATSMAAVVLFVAVSNYVPKEISDGTLGVSKLLVPQFGVLYTGRALAWLITTVTLIIGVAIPAWLATFTVSFFEHLPLGQALGAKAFELVLICLIVMLLFGTALVMQRSGMVVLAALMVLIVLPLVLAMSSMYLPEVVSKVLASGSRGLVGSLIGNALMQELTTAESWKSALKYLSGVALWSTTLVGLGWIWFRRPAYGTS